MKKRKSRRQSAKATTDAPTSGTQANDNVEIKIGQAKQRAIRNILSFASPKSYLLMQTHQSILGVLRSGVTDQILSWKHMWPTSAPCPDMMPNEAEEIARQSAAQVARKSVCSRLATVALDFASPLSVEEHEMMIAKMLSVYENEVTKSPDTSVASARPNLDTLWTYRFATWQHLSAVRSTSSSAEAVGLQSQTCCLPLGAGLLPLAPKHQDSCAEGSFAQ